MREVGVSAGVSDTPNMAVDWCPGCAPGRDPLREILVERYCDGHAVGVWGVEDGKVEQTFLPVGEADGETCRAFAELLRGG